MTVPQRILTLLLALNFAFLGNAAVAQNAEEGQQAFRKCAMCHSNEEGVNKIGPSLFGIVGRIPGTFEGFRFSPAMQEFGSDGKVWNEKRLNEYLLSPRTVVPGNRMGLAGIRDETERLNLIEYLKTLK